MSLTEDYGINYGREISLMERVFRWTDEERREFYRIRMLSPNGPYYSDTNDSKDKSRDK